MKNKENFSKIYNVLMGIAASFILFGMLSINVFAAPRTMSDGGIFDPEYYAASNPDVTAALGTDANTLYNHYLQYGKNEGRKPYADYNPAATNPAAATAPGPVISSSSGSTFTVGSYTIAKAYTNSKLSDDLLLNNVVTAFTYLPPELLNEFLTTNNNTMTYNDMAHDARFATGRVSGYNKQTWSILNGNWTLANSAINICTDCSSADSYHMLGSTVHEFGHYFDAVMGSPSNSQVWKQLLASEYNSTGLASYYSTSGEYFAEQFAIYLLPDRSVYNVSKSQCPQSQAYMANLVAQYNASMGAK